jgi:uncharacterized protein (TIGR03067 family)
MCIPILFLVSAGAFLGADPVRGEAEQKELAKFQGTWKVLSYEEDGKKRPADEIKNSRLIFQGAAFAVRNGDRIEERGTQKLDLSQEPRAVDHTITEGTDKGKTYPGIYRIAGDRLTFCFAPAGKKRPTEFRSKPGSGYYLISYQRDKP